MHLYIFIIIILLLRLLYGLGVSGIAAEENYKHLSRHTGQQYESIAMTLLSKMFSVHVISKVHIDSKIDKNCIEFDGFSS